MKGGAVRIILADRVLTVGGTLKYRFDVALKSIRLFDNSCCLTETLSLFHIDHR